MKLNPEMPELPSASWKVIGSGDQVLTGSAIGATYEDIDDKIRSAMLRFEVYFPDGVYPGQPPGHGKVPYFVITPLLSQKPQHLIYRRRTIANLTGARSSIIIAGFPGLYNKKVYVIDSLFNLTIAPLGIGSLHNIQYTKRELSLRSLISA